MFGPVNIDKKTWYYEEKKGINIVRQIMNKNDKYITTEQILIPWPFIRISLARKDKKKLPNIKLKKIKSIG